MGSFYLSPESALIFVGVSLGWLVLVGVGGWYWLTSYVPWDWPGGVNWGRLLLGSLVQGFCAAQVGLFFLLAGTANVLFLTPGVPLAPPHPAVVALYGLVTGPFWLSLSVFDDGIPVLLGALLLYAGVYLAVNLAGQMAVVRQRR